MEFIFAAVTVLGTLVVPMEVTHHRTRSLPRPTQLERTSIHQWW